ncbi:hypothetical protein [Burkholderia ubonensis]|uniref:hypothetical protein n=1 Tax=Burkholderia ubonensis TaxID=101571 RepID=UPI000AD4BB5F|nr:hypothetical protein [Burkholderia ubonensis]
MKKKTLMLLLLATVSLMQSSQAQTTCPPGWHIEGGHLSGGSIHGGHCVKDVPPASAPTSAGPPPDVVQYYFSLDTIYVSKTRSPSSDTDTVAFGLQVGDQMYQPFVKYLGDVGSGSLQTLGLRFGPINVKPDDTVAFTYTVINSGYDKSNEAIGQQISNLISDVTGDAINTFLEGTEFGTLGNFLTHQLNNVFYASCDGVVAADKIDQEWQLANSVFFPPTGPTGPAPGQPIVPLRGSDIWTITAPGPLRKTIAYPGTSSTIGCGGNSLYYVTFTISRRWH